MKIFKHRNIMGCIFGLMLSLPLLAVLARSAYVIVNKNAYESYSADQSLTYQLVDNQSTLKELSQYQFVSNSDLYQNRTLAYIQASDFVNVSGSFTVPSNLTKFRIYYNGNNQSYSLELVGSTTTYNVLSTSTYFAFNFISTAEQTNNSYLSNILFFNYSTQQSLDNVFEYSLDRVIENNNFGNINFLEWFEDMFLSDNQVNNRYVHYFNWYLNYTMFVSCAYILFLCLMWFVNFSRRLLERGMNYDW